MGELIGKPQFEKAIAERESERQRLEQEFLVRVSEAINGGMEQGRKKIELDSYNIPLDTEMMGELNWLGVFPKLDGLRRQITKTFKERGYSVRWSEAGGGREAGCSIVPWEVTIR